MWRWVCPVWVLLCSVEWAWQWDYWAWLLEHSSSSKETSATECLDQIITFFIIIIFHCMYRINVGVICGGTYFNVFLKQNKFSSKCMIYSCALCLISTLNIQIKIKLYIYTNVTIQFVILLSSCINPEDQKRHEDIGSLMAIMATSESWAQYNSSSVGSM